MPKEVPGQELNSSFANKFWVRVQLDVARIVFGEQASDDAPISYHSAQMMLTSDAVELANLILKLAKDTTKAATKAQH